MDPVRYLSTDDIERNRPVHAVWEITLLCDLKCAHCGSRAGHRRPNELSTDEALEVVQQLARLGTREVTLIGGEAYLRRDWIEIVRAIADSGMMCTLQTGARNLTEERIRDAKAAGLAAVGVSVDGLRELHDDLRGVPGSFDAAFDALARLRANGITTSVNTQITRPVLPQLRDLMERFIGAGVKNWQVQLTVAMGRAADNWHLLLQPYEMLELMPLLGELYEKAAPRGLLLQTGNNIGYFGPYEALLRGSGDDTVHWSSCPAGRVGLGIEADGTIKGCPSLPTTTYAGGNIRDATLEDIWNHTSELSFSRRKSRSELWGFCRSCYYADVCIGGCTWTAHSLLDRRGNNPYCHHRALELAGQGLRERIVEQKQPASGQSFDHGRFEVVCESVDGTAVSSTEWANEVVEDAPGESVETADQRAQRRLLFLDLCRGCNRHVFPDEDTCPHCGADIRALAKTYAKDLADARRAQAELLAILGSIPNA